MPLLIDLPSKLVQKTHQTIQSPVNSLYQPLSGQKAMKLDYGRVSTPEQEQVLQIDAFHIFIPSPNMKSS
jgi:hypothetical protein